MPLWLILQAEISHVPLAKRQNIYFGELYVKVVNECKQLRTNVCVCQISEKIGAKYKLQSTEEKQSVIIIFRGAIVCAVIKVNRRQVLCELHILYMAGEF